MTMAEHPGNDAPGSSSMPGNSQIPKAKRDPTVDVLKGLTLVGMTLANTANHATAPSWLLHSGFGGPTTFADTIYPCFIFASGLTAKSKPAKLPVLKRILVLGIYGVAFNMASDLIGRPQKVRFPSKWRLPSVLGRIGMASAVASLDAYVPQGLFPVLLLTTRLVIHPLLSGPDIYTDPSQSIDSKLDAGVFGRSHLYDPKTPFDPEGLFASVMTAPLTLLGGTYFRRIEQTLMARWTQNDPTSSSRSNVNGPKATEATPLISTQNEPRDSALNALAAGIAAAALFAVGKGLSYTLQSFTGQPSSKNYWTPVYVAETAITSIGYYYITKACLAVRKAVAIVPWVSPVADYIADRLESAGILSLEVYVLQGVLGGILSSARLSSNETAWSLVTSSFQKLGFSMSTAGVLTSCMLSWLLVEIAQTFRRYNVRFRV